MIAKLRSSLDGWINEQFVSDMKYFHERLLEDFRWFKGINEDRKAALIELSALMGYKNLCGLSEVLFALERQDFEEAASFLRDEKACQQTKGRSARLADVILNGTYGT
jgi:hypothetical protein